MRLSHTSTNRNESYDNPIQHANIYNSKLLRASRTLVVASAVPTALSPPQTT